MNFNSFNFLLFFSVVAALYFAVTMNFRNERFASLSARFILLSASLFFYACWNVYYLALILISVVITYTSGILMEGRSAERKRLILAFSLVINLSILFVFKYYGFFTGTAARLFGEGLKFPAFNLLLPVGISFYTFQALGYSMDVYYGRVKAERSFLTYALFVTFFPQLVAGPIERASNLLPQFKVNHVFDYDRVTSGLRLAAWGMFKKVVIADHIAVYVNGVYGNPAAYPSLAVALATFFFAIQIYCDFSGYSDIAIGCARALGFNLMTNFKCPYFASSITEFWRRWHISLSTWFKDYVYIPLGGNRRGAMRRNVNLFVTFLLSGLWHGAAWHFVLWGALHGILLIGERTFTGAISKATPPPPLFPHIASLLKPFKILFTFILVCLAWVLFRAKDFNTAMEIYAKFLSLPTEIALYAKKLPSLGFVETVREALQMGANSLLYFYMKSLVFSFASIAVLLLFDLWVNSGIKLRVPAVLRWTGYYALIMTIFLKWNAGSQQFIYFTF